MSEPTLPELLRSSRHGRAIGAGLIVVVTGLVAFFVFGRGESFSYDGPDAPPFSISWGSELEEVEPQDDELLRLQGPSTELSVIPLETGTDDEPLPELAIIAGKELEEPVNETLMRRVLEGRTKLAVDRGPEAYQVALASSVRDGEMLIGKVFYVPDPDRPGVGVGIKILESTSNSRVIEKVEEAPSGFFLNYPIQLLLEDATSIRTDEAFEKPLRSFEFG